MARLKRGVSSAGNFWGYNTRLILETGTAERLLDYLEIGGSDPLFRPVRVALEMWLAYYEFGYYTDKAEPTGAKRKRQQQELLKASKKLREKLETYAAVAEDAFSDACSDPVMQQKISCQSLPPVTMPLSQALGIPPARAFDEEGALCRGCDLCPNPPVTFQSIVEDLLGALERAIERDLDFLSSEEVSKYIMAHRDFMWVSFLQMA